MVARFAVVTDGENEGYYHDDRELSYRSKILFIFFPNAPKPFCCDSTNYVWNLLFICDKRNLAVKSKWRKISEQEFVNCYQSTVVF